MSANNFIHIIKAKDSKGEIFRVYDKDIETRGGIFVAESTSFSEARRIAYEYEKDNEVEYGIKIDENCYA